jgi:metal-sulfur cluster biosynthetic enzyme
MEHAAINLDTSLQQVQEALSTVCDPELDEPVTQLGFIREVSIDKDRNVSVHFRLPTYWCSANFAYLMASDMCEAISRLPWTGAVHIQLIDHFTAPEVSSGASSGRTFQESFPSEAEEDLESIRLIFRRKSFQKRQEMLLRHLLGQGETIHDLVEFHDLAGVSVDALQDRSLDAEGIALRTRYLQSRTALGLNGPSSGPAFHDVEGKALDAAEFTDYMLGLRRVRLNMEFNATICRGLLEVRYGVRQQDGLVQIDGVMTREISTEFGPRPQTPHARPSHITELRK